MRFQNDFGVFAIFFELFGLQAKRILFESNKIVCPVLSCSGQASALIKKKPDCEAIGFQKQTMENQMWQS